MGETLRMFSVYDHPRDHPAHFVVRPWRCGQGGISAEPIVCVGTELADIRCGLAALGLVCIPPNLGDDPVIVETWL